MRRHSRASADLGGADCFVWSAETGSLEPVHRVNRVDIGLIKGVDRVRDILVDNTERFAAGPAGQQRAAVGRARHGQVVAGQGRPRQRSTPAEGGSAAEAGRDPPRGHRHAAEADERCCKSAPYRFILFCDDLSFDHDDTSYKSLKAALEGGVEGRPDNVIFYATSNRRHLLPRDMIDNERSTAINPSEAVEEKVSLSDRFGLWLGFHKCSQDDYLAMIDGYVAYHGLEIEPEQLRAEALEWATTRGSRSGRVAWQFTQDLAGRLGQDASAVDGDA